MNAIEHGTARGYGRCVKRPQGSCAHCRRAIADYMHARVRAKNWDSVRIVHGTRYGYQQCVRRSIGSCADCRGAERRYQGSGSKQTVYGRRVV